MEPKCVYEIEDVLNKIKIKTLHIKREKWENKGRVFYTLCPPKKVFVTIYQLNENTYG